MDLFLGIDLGGTSCKAGIIDENGRILKKGSVRTDLLSGQEAIIDNVAKLALELIAESGFTISLIKACGIGAPGTTDDETGTLIYANNLPFKHLPVRSIFSKTIDLPVFIDNDANLAALAESVTGAARDTCCSVLLTLGTGVGGGLIINGEIYKGFNQAGCEPGHMVIISDGELCTCGRHGCLEAYASASALIRQTEQAARVQPSSLLNRLIADNGGRADGRTAFVGARKGDASAKEVVEMYIKLLAEGITNIINLYMPEVIVLGGGLSHEGDDLIVPVRKKAIPEAYLGTGVPVPRIELAELGNDAGIIGAALLARQSWQKKLAG